MLPPEILAIVDDYVDYSREDLHKEFQLRLQWGDEAISKEWRVFKSQFTWFELFCRCFRRVFGCETADDVLCEPDIGDMALVFSVWDADKKTTYNQLRYIYLTDPLGTREGTIDFLLRYRPW